MINTTPLTDDISLNEVSELLIIQEEINALSLERCAEFTRGLIGAEWERINPKVSESDHRDDKASLIATQDRRSLLIVESVCLYKVIGEVN